MAHKARRRRPAAHDTGQGGKLHATGGFSGVIATNGHNAVALRQHGGNTFTASAGGHGIINHGVEVVVIHGSAGGLFYKFIDPLPLAQNRIQAFALFDRLVGSGGIDFIGCFTIHPVIGTAQPGPFGADRAHMVGGKGLAKGAGVVSFHILIGHLFHAFVAGFVLGPGALGQFIDILFFGIKGDLYLVDDFLKILVEFGMQHGADILHGKAFVNGRFADTDPGNVALPDVHDSLNIVDQVMDLAFDDRFKIRLKFTPGNLDINAQRHGFALFDGGNIRSDNIDFAVLDFIHFGHFDQLGALGFAAAHLRIKIGAAHPLAFISRPEGAGNIDRGHCDL